MSYDLAAIGATFAVLLVLLSGLVGVVLFLSFMLLNALIEIVKGN